MNVWGGTARPERDVQGERRKFEILMYDVSTTFIDLPASAVDAAVTDVLERIATALRLDRVLLSQLSPDNTTLTLTHFWAAPGIDTPPLPIVATQRFPRAAELILAGSDFMFERLEDVPSDFVLEREFFLAEGTKSHLTVPLIVGRAVLGGLSCASLRAPRRWPPFLIRRVRLLGQILANALARRRSEEALEERARALEEGRQQYRALAEGMILAQEDERRRIARELHDDVIQRLAVLSISTEKLRRRAGNGHAGYRAGLDRLLEQIKTLVLDLEHLSHRLHPATLEHVGLTPALRALCRDLSQEHGVQISFASRGVPVDLPKATALCYYRIAQEALRNVIRHSEAPEARVELEGTPAEMILRVVDSGTGFDPARLPPKEGLGLVSMEERARLIGGVLTIDSQPSRGTRVELRSALEPGA